MSNIAFSRVLKMNGRLWEFNFRKLPGDSPTFHTDFTDERGNRIMFTLLKDDAQHWAIRENNIPEWIRHSTPQLGEALQEFM